MNKIIKQIRVELKELSKNPENVKDYSIFHKDSKKHIGLATPIVRKLSAKRFREVKDLDKGKIFVICEKLLISKNDSCRDIAFDWAFRLKKLYSKEDFAIFEKWLNKYVDTWGSCDDFCTHAFGEFILQFPEFLPKLKKWACSKNRWLRRASAVILIYPNRRGKYINNVFLISDILLQDRDDLVQKGYGWMLKELSNLYPKKVYQYVMKNKKKMPRTALRYAIEKLPRKLKKEAMEIDWR